MTENTGFTAYSMYHALKLHFTSNSYDYQKYNGKTNVSKTTFETNKSKYQFYKLSRKYSLEELRDFYVANFLNGDSNWVGNMLTTEGEENYRKWQKRIQSLTYTFDNDTMYLFDKYTPTEMLNTTGDYPKLLQELMEGNISIETVVYIDILIGIVAVWNKKIQDDILWPNWELKLRKYKPFAFDQLILQKCEYILKERIRDAKTKN
jgi:hypothetical protein